jgi:hypothetical protein
MKRLISAQAMAVVATVCVALAPAYASADPFEIINFDGGVFEPNGDPTTQAGSHPFTASTEFDVNSVPKPPTGWLKPFGSIKDVTIDLPAGLVGNPQAVPVCPDLGDSEGPQNPCPDESQVGFLQLRTSGAVGAAVLYNVAPPPGKAAMFKFLFRNVPIYITGEARPGDYRIRTLTLNSPQTFAISGVRVVLWGVPADPGHDDDRGEIGGQYGAGSCADLNAPPSCSNPSSAPLKPFITLPTSCVGPVDTDMTITTWENEEDSRSFASHDNALPVPNPIGNDGCGDVPFTPGVDVAPTSAIADSAAGVGAEITVPDDGLLAVDGVSQSHLRKTVVELPEGVSVNPSSATGLASCSDAQLGLGTEDEPSCPEASKIGTVDVQSPLLAEHLTGEVVLRRPNSTDPLSGGMLRTAIVARSDERGILVKIPGSATADPVTGRLVATFDDNPQLPFSDLKVSFKGGSRGIVALPQDCGQFETSAELSPWSGTAPVTDLTPTTVGGDCSLGFAPKVEAGSSTAKARGSGTFSFRFSRQDGEQWIDGLTANLPTGLLASVKDLPLCSGAQADAGACPASSRIGTVDASAGSGTPFVLERKGDAYLTEGYKGCPYGLAVKVPVVAGPFDGSSPETDLGNIVVRQKVCVDPSTARVSVVSDPFPTIWHGIPLRTRSVTVNVDRPGFMLNPSDCSGKQTDAVLHSARGASANASAPFYASGCANLPFKPKLTLALTGKGQTKTGKHPGVKAVATQKGVSEAGIERVEVRLPKSVALDPENAQALCEFDQGTRPDLENRCPKGSIVGQAKAASPLLNRPLTGNVYFVKNVRKDPTTGNLIRTLPMIIVALRGEIAVNLRGESSTTKSGKLVNTFANIPDAPISKFDLNIDGGANGILAVTRTRKAKINLCAGRHVAEADMDGQNGRRYDTDVRMKTPCTKKQTKAAKLRAKRAAAKAKRG